MKCFKYALIPLSIAAVDVAQAQANLPPKTVSIPFTNEKILSQDHSGLVFNYAMEADKKIVCKLTNIYKSWIEYRDQSSMKQTGTYGGYQTVIFTAKGQDNEMDESTSKYHADRSGVIKVNEVEYYLSKHSTASCYYAADNSVK